MTEFVLVPGLFTGPHVWRETAARLEAEGARAHLVDLPGRRAGTDVAADVALVVETVDAIDAATEGDGPEIVLVGHDYGVHPAVGAADRRPGRVARIVYVDTAPVRDGVPALAGLPDQELRERLAAAGDTDGVLDPPARDAWPRWGSTAGVPEAALDRLADLAAPQPLGTLLRPLRLTGAELPPTTGVLCAESGATLATVRMLLSFGDPMMKALATTGTTFFELPTGHWPMLSCPDRLAEVLLAAAAGEGESLVDTTDACTPTAGYLKPFLLDVTERPRERRGSIDLYVPEGAGETPRPAIVFVHGGPVPEGAEPTPRDWPTLVGYARYAADEGVVGVTLDHRLHAVTAYPTAAADLEAAVAEVRADPRVDADRIALWFLSGSGPLTAPWLGARPPWLRCLAANYPIMAPLPGWGVNDARFRPAEVVARGGTPPFVLVRAGRETSAIAATVAEFLAAAEEGGAPVEVVDVPDAPHGFEGLDHSDSARDAVREAMRRVLGRLTAPH
ncbi:MULTISPECIES: alpha/beta hydrolase [unclassified Streptomyces]|uniref:alpha/beta hydrolase n=1 Tax=unclassified Streptomyces TaxID=2593676 RepID=UPI000DB94E35|nr:MULTISPECIES: alpha/beta hydrolase [unclassified Streptomyces]MYT75376.1 alpha/beta hydrolase [Streptomyces sp. SID8367]RAJ86778.1 dipeptidyl aminopeptidase/acylaminoacyl peptidase [Streptomyces sp. PsTaAH-137]